MSKAKQEVAVAAPPKVLVIELVNQQPSNFVLDGAGEDVDLPTRLSAPNARKIRNRSKVRYVENGIAKLRPIRYIKGCDEIFVDLQEKMGFQPNPAVDVIWILNGKLTVVENEGDIGLYNYLKNYEGNVDNPNRPANAADVFQEINTEIEAIETENIFDDELQVLNYLNKLKSKNKDNSYEYNEDTISFLCNLFKLPPYESGYKSEAWVSLVMKAKEDPKKFLNTVLSMVALVESEVNQAIAKGVIGMDEEKAFFVSSNMVIMNLPQNASSDEAKDALVDFFSNPENRVKYDNLRTEMHQLNTRAAEVVH